MVRVRAIILTNQEVVIDILSPRKNLIRFRDLRLVASLMLTEARKRIRIGISDYEALRKNLSDRKSIRMLRVVTLQRLFKKLYKAACILIVVLKITVKLKFSRANSR